MRRFLICEVLCIAAFGCNAAPEDPVEGGVRQVVTTPTPPATGIQPTTGWGNPEPGVTYQRNNDGSVLFHGGTWTVPLSLQPGQQFSDVAFTIEGQYDVDSPTNVVVALYSSLSATIIGQTNITTFGMGTYCNGDIPLAPARTVASGEMFELVFVPLDPSGNYAVTNTKIDGVGIVAKRSFTRSFYPKIVAQGGAGPWSTIGDLSIFDAYVQSAAVNSQAFFEIPSEEGDTLTALSVDAEGNGMADCMYTVFYGAGMGTQSAIGGPTDLHRPATWGNVSMGVSSQAIGPRGGLILFAQASAPGYRIGKMHATFAR